MNNSVIYILNLLLSFTLTVISCKALIPMLKRKKVNQIILDVGPVWHRKKDGTPTMGGLSFLFSIAIILILSFAFYLSEPNGNKFILLGIIFYCILNGVIGIIDDTMKMKKGKNEGLTAKTKFLLQAIIAILFIIFLYFTKSINTTLSLPFINKKIDFGIWCYILMFFTLCGFVNAVNLTDGLDGLASAVSSTVGLLFVVASMLLNIFELGALGTCLLGGTLGFLVFNKHPAKVFMGDTGSLFLGSIVASGAILFDNFLVVLIYGFVFLLEALSVIMQVAFFKITKGKRLFKMAPLHHHLEKSGWSETSIVTAFTIINLIFCALALVFLI
ncbi:MAG: phospho-N-acetylmuramoyl-pentapeptide-transferase [Clostridia bacterium]|nr:phospho-N-acetylmuramoyl-pentapeptide-transferase [Clostridia bacterium]